MAWHRNRFLRLGLELSFLVHLILLALPEKLPLFGRAAASIVREEEPEQRPVTFELVELPQQKEETPQNALAPVSDLSRRAHGGEGEKGTKPGVKGTSAQLSLAPFQPSSEPRNGSTTQTPQLLAEERFPPPLPQGEAGSAPDGITSKSPPQAPSEPRVVIKGLSPFSAPQLGIAPDRRGGQVDMGPLSFDTQWYDWGPYAAEMLRRIRYNWRIPELAQMGVPGVVRIRFYIEKNGRVTDLTILRESSHPPMDFAARDAILNASPLPPLPEEVGVEREGVVITFYYNTRPPEDT